MSAINSVNARVQYRISSKANVCLNLLAITIAQFGMAQEPQLLDLTSSAVEVSKALQKRHVLYAVNQGEVSISGDYKANEQSDISDSPANIKLHNSDAAVINPSHENSADLYAQIKELREQNVKLSTQVRLLSEQKYRLQAALDVEKENAQRQMAEVASEPVANSMIPVVQPLTPFVPESDSLNTQEQLMFKQSYDKLTSESNMHPKLKAVQSHNQASVKVFVEDKANQGDHIRTLDGHYGHHVVYIFKTKTERDLMWALLDELGETDRWQGANTSKSRYFIYVGAYTSQYDARDRASSLSAIVGVAPIIYSDKPKV